MSSAIENTNRSAERVSVSEAPQSGSAPSHAAVAAAARPLAIFSGCLVLVMLAVGCARPGANGPAADAERAS